MNTHLRLGLALALLLIAAVTALRARDASAPAGKNAGGAKMLTPAQALADFDLQRLALEEAQYW